MKQQNGINIHWFKKHVPWSAMIEWWKYHGRPSKASHIMMKLIEGGLYTWALWFFEKIVNYESYAKLNSKHYSTKRRQALGALHILRTRFKKRK